MNDTHYATTIRAWIIYCKQYLRHISASEEEREIMVLSVLQEVLSMDLTDLALNLHMPIASDCANDIKVRMRRLLKEEPLAYVLGKKSFFGYEFLVTKATLIPRGDSECLVEAVIDHIERVGNIDDSQMKILDLGCGTGCLSLAVLKHCIADMHHHLSATLVDIDDHTLQVAMQNATLLGLSHLCQFFQMDFTADGFADQLCNAYDIIIANPPYIGLSDLVALDMSVMFEPFKALYGGPDGLQFYRALAKLISAGTISKENTLVVLEIGSEQREAVKNIFAPYKKLSLVSVIKDLSRRDRVILFVYHSDGIQ